MSQIICTQITLVLKIHKYQLHTVAMLYQNIRNDLCIYYLYVQYCAKVLGHHSML